MPSDTEQYDKNRKFRYQMLDVVSSLMPKNRVASCCRHVPRHNKEGVVISKNPFGRAYYSGLNVCSSVWHCPHCAEKISSTRAQEITEATCMHVADGGWGLFLTLTFSHKKKDNLSTILEAQSKAHSSMCNSTRYKKLMARFGSIGSIKALEVTHGKNGWHPHSHEVIFIDRKINQAELKEFKQTVFELWSYYCVKFGLGKPNYSGVDIQIPQSMDSMVKYVTKWGYELTHLNMKSGKNGSRTPFQILADVTKRYNYHDAKLFIEYAESFKGKRQLRWSKGLKRHFGLVDKTDKQIAEGEQPERICVIPKKDWYNVMAADHRSQVLQLAEQGGAVAVKIHLVSLAEILSHMRSLKFIYKKHTDEYSALKSRRYSHLGQLHRVNEAKELRALKLQHARELSLLKEQEQELISKYSVYFNRDNAVSVNHLLN